MTIFNHQFENSSMLQSCSYDTESEELTVTFTNGKPYTYVDVDALIYDDLTHSASAGRYFNSIKANLEIKK